MLDSDFEVEAPINAPLPPMIYMENKGNYRRLLIRVSRQSSPKLENAIIQTLSLFLINRGSLKQVVNVTCILGVNSLTPPSATTTKLGRIILELFNWKISNPQHQSILCFRSSNIIINKRYVKFFIIYLIFFLSFIFRYTIF